MTSPPADLAAGATPGEVADAVIALYDRDGGRPYDESVSEREHAEQAAALARADGATDRAVVAAALHDIGHLLLREYERADRLTRDDRHEVAGARFVAQWFGEEMAAAVRLHVDAKRFLCATEPPYAAILSPASAHSLDLQGGPMGSAEVTAFAADPAAGDAVALRRWDDAAKVPRAAVAPLRSHRATIEGLVLR